MIKRGVKVQILRTESYWFNKIGTIATTVDENEELIKYPILVRFEDVNYSGVNTNNYNINELKEIRAI
uniref:Subunit IV of photosystem I n=1 Tax=Climaconeis cf. scalaris TaxID=2846828 RepID=A0A8F8SR69_9STRA|nr:subunit IV of photosystem I [Climaconeis cf. scalaris]QYB19143.1 subunit IV of photosystem I [Climaconeis cf. scalaris]